MLALIPLNVNVWFDPELVTFVVKSSMSKTSPLFNEPPDLGSTTAIVKLSVFLAANVPPFTVIENPPEPTFTVVCLRIWIDSAVCVLTKSLGHDAIAAVWSCLNILTLRLVQFALPNTPTLEVATVWATISLVIVLMTCSAPAPSIIISPSLSSLVNLVPKPVKFALLIEQVPVRVLSWSA